MSDWHGWEIGGVSYHVGRYPTRKQVCLYRSEGANSTPAAYFISEGEASRFLRWLDRVAVIQGVES